ncbi:MAG: hypothetical protein M1834_008295 [Cirrosporium novae-zelandiae]|nr:MAG: hypothetical protein M1834_008295 [Cirrosporium novae-zelandiae]
MAVPEKQESTDTSQRPDEKVDVEQAEVADPVLPEDYKRSDPNQHARLTMDIPSLSEADRKKVLLKMDMRLIPMLILLYLLCFLDRGNIGNAKIEGLTEDLNLTGSQYNICLTVFFFTYSAFEVPSNLLLKRLRPSIWLPSIMVAWGVVMTLMGLVQSYYGLLIARIFLGVAEAGLYPGVAYYLTMWYVRTEVQIRQAAFYSGASIAGAFSGLLAYAIAKMDGVAGQAGWRWIFILEGIATVIVACVAFFLIYDFPDTASFLTDEERAWVVHRLRYQHSEISETQHFEWKFVKAAFLDWQIYLGLLMYWSIVCPLYGISFFLPTIIKALGYESSTAQLLTVPIYVTAATLTVVLAYFSDHHGKRSPYILAAQFTILVGFLLCIVGSTAGSDGHVIPGLVYAGVFIAVCGIYPAFPGNITWIANNLSPLYKRGAGMAIHIGIGNLGGAMASNFYRSQDSPQFVLGHALELGFVALGIVAVVIMRVVYGRINRKREMMIESDGVDLETDHEKLGKLGNRAVTFRSMVQPNQDVYTTFSKGVKRHQQVARLTSTPHKYIPRYPTVTHLMSLTQNFIILRAPLSRFSRQNYFKTPFHLPQAPHIHSQSHTRRVAPPLTLTSPHIWQASILNYSLKSSLKTSSKMRGRPSKPTASVALEDLPSASSEPVRKRKRAEPDTSVFSGEGRRARKFQGSYKEEDEDEEDLDLEEEVKPKKRVRGGKKVTEKVAVKATAMAASSPKKGRGRLKAKDEVDAVDDEEEVIAPTPKRARRATKAKVQVEEDLAVEDEEDDIPAVKPRGRQSKAKKVVEEEQEQELEEKNEETVTPKKILPRRRKTKAEKDAEAMPLAERTEGLNMYIGAHVSIAKGVQNSVTNSLHIGGNAFALFLKSQRKWESPPLKDGDKELFLSSCKQHSYDSTKHVLPHGSYLVNLAQSDPVKNKQAYTSFIDDLHRCESLGIRYYNFHPGAAGTAPRDEAITRIATALNQAHQETKTVIPVLENMATRGTIIGGTFEDLRDIIAQVSDKSRIGVCLDTCHTFASGYDLRTPTAFQKTLSEFDSIIGLSYLKALHLNDSKAPLGANKDLHQNIGLGFLGLRAFHNVMNYTPFQNLPMILETPIDQKSADNDSKTSTTEDKGIWAREIKLLESLVGMDIESEEFLKLERELAARGEAERKTQMAAFEKKNSAKDAATAAAVAGKGKGKQRSLKDMLTAGGKKYQESKKGKEKEKVEKEKGNTKLKPKPKPKPTPELELETDEESSELSDVPSD